MRWLPSFLLALSAYIAFLAFWAAPADTTLYRAAGVLLGSLALFSGGRAFYLAVGPRDCPSGEREIARQAKKKRK